MPGRPGWAVESPASLHVATLTGALADTRPAAHVHEIALNRGVDVVCVLLEQLARHRELHGAHAAYVQRLLVPERLHLLHAREDDGRGARHSRRQLRAVLLLGRACARAIPLRYGD